MLNFENNQIKIKIDDDYVKLIDNVVTESIREFTEKHRLDGEVNVYLVDNEEMRGINKEQRGIDRTTDVLSFPMNDIELYGDDPEDLDINPENNCIMLGDILISMEKCVEQAEENDHSIYRELGFLVAHGVHHLLGYDHENSEDEEIMINRQEMILHKIGLARVTHYDKQENEK